MSSCAMVRLLRGSFASSASATLSLASCLARVDAATHSPCVAGGRSAHCGSAAPVLSTPLEPAAPVAYRSRARFWTGVRSAMAPQGLEIVGDGDVHARLVPPGQHCGRRAMRCADHAGVMPHADVGEQARVDALATLLAPHVAVVHDRNANADGIDDPAEDVIRRGVARADDAARLGAVHQLVAGLVDADASG